MQSKIPYNLRWPLHPWCLNIVENIVDPWEKHKFEQHRSIDLCGSVEKPSAYEWICTVQALVVQGSTVVYALHNNSSCLLRNWLKGGCMTQFWQRNVMEGLQESLSKKIFIFGSLLQLDTMTSTRIPPDMAARGRGRQEPSQHENDRETHKVTWTLHYIAAAELI